MVLIRFQHDSGPASNQCRPRKFCGKRSAAFEVLLSLAGPLPPRVVLRWPRPAEAKRRGGLQQNMGSAARPSAPPPPPP